GCTSTDPPPKTNDYFIDTQSGPAMSRLLDRDRFITEAMGGVFSERSDIDAMHAILDLGCGPGQWVRDVAYEYPKIEVTGIDISDIMIEYARAHARVQGLDNAHFQVMDITKPLEFGDNSFDLVNGRLIA